MSKIKLYKWDIQDHLITEEDIIAYLDAALEENDEHLIAHVLGDIAKAKGMTEIAEKANVGRESLYKSLSENGNPQFHTILKVLKALGLGLHVYRIAQ